MRRLYHLAGLAAVLWLSAAALAAENAVGQSAAVEKWTVTVGKTLIIDSSLPIDRLSVADGNLADAVAITPKEVVINGKAPGETTLVLWQKNGSRLVYDLTVRLSSARIEAVRSQIARDYPNDDITVTFDNDTAFVRGTAPDIVSAERIASIVATLGKVVNLLKVQVPPVEAQILVKVRFANVDRSASRELGADFASGAFNQISSIGTGGVLSSDGGQTVSLADAVNIFLFRKDINLAAAITALESKNQLQILSEPTVPAINGKPASFTAGGQFPFPVVQPGGGGGATSVTISWREYGVLLNFLPIITPRGTIRLQVAPEVSSLDYTHSVTVMGTTVPGIATRRVQTEIELESGQSFVIAGLIDNQTSENFSKIPGIGDIPILGKLFQSKNVSRNNNELLVIVTPELVRPIPAGQPAPEIKFPKEFMPSNSGTPMSHPDMTKTGPVPVTPPEKAIPLEQLILQQKQLQPEGAVAAPQTPATVTQSSGFTPSGQNSSTTGASGVGLK